MSKYNVPKYNKAREQIQKYIKKFGAVDEILFLMDDPDNIEQNLGFLKRMEGIDLTVKEWQDLSLLELEAHRKYIIRGKETEVGVTVSNENEDNKFQVPIDKHSNWQIFKRNKLEKEMGFPNKTIESIESDTHGISKRLSIKNVNDKPVKGLVIGGVQSGKTTNMASLMAMSGDMGFNMVIILSGTVENLRVQTENRISELIDGTSRNRDWKLVKNPENSTNNRLYNLFGQGTNLYMVVLKNVTRLRNLIEWITSSDFMQELKVLVIDDESDQASVNTSKDPEFDRKSINQLIVNLVHGNEKSGKKAKNKYMSMNYIGYTATPYANILSEKPSDYSLYPQTFITTLTQSPQHFGPSEIFGYLDCDDSGLNITREILVQKEVHQELVNGKLTYLPTDLKEALAYYLAGAVSLRLHNFRKPVSMLIHLSSRIMTHEITYKLIDDWLKNNKNEFLELSENIWTNELGKVTVDDISKRVYINEYRTLKPHTFEELRPELERIISRKDFLTIKEDGNINYHDGIIYAIDNSSNIGLDKNKIQRLQYPDNKIDQEHTPIYIVIGGATLSRGLTLEGLITSYFLRSPSAADTLTQMGRWFGYRINYELYPRIWLSDKSKEQFQFVSKLERELYQEIYSLKQAGVDFRRVGPKIINSPQYVELTSRNKRYAQKTAEYDFTGFTTQTDKFDDNLEIQKENVLLTENFINSLGSPNIINNRRTSNIYWDGVPFEIINKNLLSKFNFNKRIRSLNNISQLIEWITKVTKDENLSNWNVILGGVGLANVDSNNWKLKYVNYNMVNRTKLAKSMIGEIDIGVLSAPTDRYADIDVTKVKDPNILELLKDSNALSKKSTYEYIRSELDMNKVPQLVIYKIDKNSEVRDSSDKVNRYQLGINTDLIGLFIQIPRGDKRINYSTSVTVDLDDYEFENLLESDVVEAE